MRRFIASFLIAAIILFGKAAYANTAYFPETVMLKDVFSPTAMDTIKQGIIVFEDGKVAEMDVEDIESFLQLHLNFTMDRYTQPYYPDYLAYPYFNFYGEDGKGYTFFRSKAICAIYGEQNFLWYQPSVGNARNLLSQKIEELSKKYRAQAKPMQVSPIFPLQNVLKVPEAKWAVAEIQEAAAKNLVPVTLTEQYSMAITRDDFCLLISQMLSQIHTAGSSSYAIDVEENLKKILFDKTGVADIKRFYSDCENTVGHIDLLTALGIINGRGDNIFDPEGIISREEAAKILYSTAAQLIELSNANAYYKDFENVSSWAKEAVAWAQDTNVMQGIGEELFDPQGTFTTEQAIVSVLRLFNLIECNK